MDEFAANSVPVFVAPFLSDSSADQSPDQDSEVRTVFIK